MIRQLTVTLTSCALLLAALQVTAQEFHRSAQHDFNVTTVAEDLEVPWSMAWLPNGDMLVTERKGALRIIRNGNLLAAPVEGIPAVHHEGQGGLFDVVPHPDFASNNLLYLVFAKPLGGDASTTTVVRGTFQIDRFSNVETIFQAQTEGRNGHYGGRLVFDGTGHIFVTVGERQASPALGADHPAQDRSNHHGVVVRLNEDGSVPADNPFVGEDDVLPEIYSYGHRNPQSLAIHPMTGDLWEGEHGPQGGDELNIIEAGNNYGWPVIGYGVNYGPGTPIHSSHMARGMENPKHFWVPSIATSGLMIYNGDLFPRWRGDIFVGGMAGQQLARVDLGSDYRTVIQDETILAGIGRIRDVRQGPDGAVYLATENRGILRLTPAD